MFSSASNKSGNVNFLQNSWRQRVGTVEIFTNTNTNDIASLRAEVTSNEAGLSDMGQQVATLEDTLTCSGAGVLDVCGCANGFTYYQDECVVMDIK